MLLTYTVKSRKVLALIEERQNLRKIKDPLSFEIWIFRSGQPDRDDDSICLTGGQRPMSRSRF